MVETCNPKIVNKLQYELIALISSLVVIHSTVCLCVECISDWKSSPLTSGRQPHHFSDAPPIFEQKIITGS